MRIRDFGLRMGRMLPGTNNAITDVPGLRVGHSTLCKDISAEKAVRTGVTVVVPSEDIMERGLYAGVFSLNGNGELCGSHWIRESGLLTTPIALTNTHSLGLVRDAMIKYYYKKSKLKDSYWMLPVVGETWDGWLSDINGMHVTEDHLYEALDSATSGPVAEGCVGSGTGMILHEFKGGIGTSSRVLKEDGGYTVGVLVQANYGKREELVIDNIPVGRLIGLDKVPGKCEQAGNCSGKGQKGDGSIIIIVATDAPLLPDQCRRLAKRAALGLARTGSIARDSSGDIFLAFSTTGPEHGNPRLLHGTIRHEDMDELFNATVEATHEAIVNSLCAAKNTSGMHGRKIYSLPHEMLKDIIERYRKMHE